MTKIHKYNRVLFRAMQGFMKLADKVHPHVPALAESFGIRPGMVVVDYGCGPGRYTVEFARLTGPDGKVIAVDLVEIALQETEKKVKQYGFNNVELKLAQGYGSGIPEGSADMVCAVDMFHHVDPEPFLKEVSRIAKPDGTMVISGGHQTRNSIKRAVASTGLWALSEEAKTHMIFRKMHRRTAGCCCV